MLHLIFDEDMQTCRFCVDDLFIVVNGDMVVIVQLLKTEKDDKKNQESVYVKQ